MRIKVIIITVLIIIAFMAGAGFAIFRDIPSIKDFERIKTPEGTKVYAEDGTLIGEFKIQKGIYIPIKQIPKHLINAVVAVEDSRFWKHKGIDYIGIGRALVTDIFHMKLKEGGSTITQQLAKIMFLTPEKTLSRKVKEAYLAMKIERELSKEKILELYLNNVYFGHGAYGVEMASRIYFGKPVNQITLPEAALLAGLIRAPNAYSPYNDLVRAKQRQEIVLERMEKEEFISPQERKRASNQSIHLSSLRISTENYNYFLEYVRKQLEENFDIEKIYKGNLRVYTTLDPHAQISAQRALQEGLREVDKRMGWRGSLGKVSLKEDTAEEKVAFTPSQGDIARGTVISVNPNQAVIKARGIKGKLNLQDAQWASKILDPSGKIKILKSFKLTDILSPGDIVMVRFKSVGKEILFSLEQEPEIEGALAALDPQTGYIKAMVGGYSFQRGEFNRAVYAKRQPGSSFKPFVYAAAIEKGFSPEDTILDEPISYRTGLKEWSPSNYDGEFWGEITLRRALAFSRNVPTVRLAETVGIDSIINLAKKAGITSEIPADLSLALGSLSLSPLELTSAFAVFANGGKKIKPIAIKYVTDNTGKIILQNEPQPEEVLSPEVAYTITEMLKDVVAYGTGTRANIGRPVAGKTGTSNEFRDAWFVGYTPQLVAGVWVGYDDMRKSLGHGEAGGRASAPIWAQFMKEVLSSREIQDFQRPEQESPKESAQKDTPPIMPKQ
ncbi:MULTISPECIES: penicillin-binding protein 1A [Thermodesulfovibrio]|jgi:penicillin-binding protein 1A|uniref:penicillin-binding protein 1A n=1 Tax=Thermodesulfovibrio TaxID=28261 RepID=UPI00261598BC|nr:PBP1A family penicillin-binding protein [Thermodesulfovibrio sp.]